MNQQLGKRIYSDRQLAELFELDELRIGRHFLRDSDGRRSGSYWIQGFWWAFVLPSFEPPMTLAVVSVRGEECFGPRTKDWLKAAFIATDVTAVVDIESDPVADALHQIDAYPASGGGSLDGIGYRLVVETLGLRSEMDFSNPQQASWKHVEASLVKLGEMVAARSGERRFLAALRAWEPYISG